MVVQWIVKAGLYPGSQTDHVHRLPDCSCCLECITVRGTSPSRVDWLTSSVTWVEQGKLPTNVIASETAADSASGGFSNPTEGATETMQNCQNKTDFLPNAS